MSGRPRPVLDDDVRLLGLDDYVFEAGAGFVVDGEVHWLAEPDTHERIAASGRARPAARALRGSAGAPHAVHRRPRGLAHPARARRRRRGRGAARRARPRRPAADRQRRGPSPLAGARRPAERAPLPPAAGAASRRPRGSPRTCAPAASRARTASRSATRARTSTVRRRGRGVLARRQRLRARPGPARRRSRATRTPASPRRATAPGVYEAVVTTLAQAR